MSLEKEVRTKVQPISRSIEIKMESNGIIVDEVTGKRKADLYPQFVKLQLGTVDLAEGSVGKIIPSGKIENILPYLTQEELEDFADIQARITTRIEGVLDRHEKGTLVLRVSPVEEPIE